MQIEKCAIESYYFGWVGVFIIYQTHGKLKMNLIVKVLLQLDNVWSSQKFQLNSNIWNDVYDFF